MLENIQNFTVYTQDKNTQKYYTNMLTIKDNRGKVIFLNIQEEQVQKNIQPEE